MKNIAVQGCTLTTSPGQGTATITTAPSAKNKCGGKFAYSGPIAISISGYSSPVITVAGSGIGSGTLNPTATKTKIDNKFAVLEGDKVQITVNGQATSPSGTVPAAELVTVTIQSAGQNKVKGN